MNMIKQMVNLFDYEEYVSLCKKNDISSNDLNKYCMGIGMLSVAKFRYPDLGWQEAYSRTIQDMNTKDEVEKKEKNGCCQDKDKKVEKPLGLIEAGKGLLADTGEHIANGLKHVSEEEYQRRIAICGEPCDELREGFRC